jgi:hypothetical protein
MSEVNLRYVNFDRFLRRTASCYNFVIAFQCASDPELVNLNRGKEFGYSRVNCVGNYGWATYDILTP